MKKILWLISLAIISVIVRADNQRLVTTGIGPTQREALMAAQRKAVEQGVGVLVDSQSLTENLELVEDKIFSRSRGYVKHFTVISQKEQDDGNWKVVIECEVAVDKIKTSLNALGILRDKMGNPRIMIVYDPTITDGIRQKYHPVISEAYEGIVEYLAEREFTIIGKKVFDQSILPEVTSPEKLNKEYTQLGLRKKAEYLLVYNIKPQDQEATNTFKKGWVMISARIINTSSGQILATQNKKVIGVDKDSLDFALRKAGRKGGKLAAKFLEQKLVKRWQTDTVSGRTVVLELINIHDFSLLVEFKTELKKAFGVKIVTLRNSTSSTAEYEITYVGDIDTLKESTYNILKKMGLKANVPTSTGDRIEIELKVDAPQKKKR
jgi:hypothetical protein